MATTRDTVQTWPFDVRTGEPVGSAFTPDFAWTNLPLAGIWQSLATRAGAEVVGEF